VTINTAAVWDDYVRDQATPPAKAEAPPDAAKGANSVATKGEPQSESTLVRVEVGPRTRIEVRYRSSTDATSLGGPTPKAAAKAETDATEGQPQRNPRREAKEAEVRDLK